MSRQSILWRIQHFSASYGCYFGFFFLFYGKTVSNDSFHSDLVILVHDANKGEEGDGWQLQEGAETMGKTITKGKSQYFPKYCKRLNYFFFQLHNWTFFMALIKIVGKSWAFFHFTFLPGKKGLIFPVFIFQYKNYFYTHFMYYFFSR